MKVSEKYLYGIILVYLLAGLGSLILSRFEIANNIFFICMYILIIVLKVGDFVLLNNNNIEYKKLIPLAIFFYPVYVLLREKRTNRNYIVIILYWFIYVVLITILALFLFDAFEYYKNNIGVILMAEFVLLGFVSFIFGLIDDGETSEKSSNIYSIMLIITVLVLIISAAMSLVLI